MEVKADTGIIIADKAYLEEWRGEIFVLIKQYFEQSKDKYSTPGKVMLDLTKSIEDPNYLLGVHQTEGKPDGFLFGKIVPGPVGRILLAFLGKGLDSKTIIRDSLEMFDNWAKEHKCIASDMYTHRHPKSYRSLGPLGWRHNYTVYRKNY